MTIFLVLASVFVSLVYAATSEDSTLSASLTVNSYVDTTVNGSTLSFGSLDPDTSDNSGGAVQLTNTANSNTVIDIYLNNSNMTTGSVFMPANNLSVHTSNAPTVSKPFNGSTYINGTSANTGFVEDLAISSSVTLFFWHDVQPAQTAGAYTATVRVRSTANGVSP